jgi:aryl carrier-like protein
LVQLSTGTLGREVHGPVNQPIFDGSAFSLFLIGALDAIRPVYGEQARDFCLIEAGAMSQLLMTEAPAHGLGLCPIGNLDAAPLRTLFALADEHLFLHSLEGGPPASDGARKEPPPAPLVETLRRHLADRLPAYMVPGSFVFLDALPLSANGKVDRRALPAVDPGEVLRPEAYAPPAGPVEERLAAIWSEVLELERVGRHDSFLDLGGDSVKGVRMLARARESGIELNIRELFEQQTIAGLSGVARTGPGASGESAAGRWSAGSELDREEIEDILEEFGDGETDDEGV